MDKTVRRLDNDLQRYRKAETTEKKQAAAEARSQKAAKTDAASETQALNDIAAQKQAILDEFTSATPPDAATAQKLATQMYALGEKAVQTQDVFEAKISGDKTAAGKDAKAVAKDLKAVKADKRQALKDLEPAEYQMNLKDTNRVREELGLKPLKKPLRDPFKPGSFKPGRGTEYGADTSNWQSDAQFRASIKGKPFAAVKATDGTSANQADFKSRWNELGKQVKSGKMKLRIAYHFLEPGQSGVAQAKKFLDTVGIHGKLQAGTRLALDWERNTSGVMPSASVLRDAANYINKVTGVWPLIYSSGSNGAAAHAAVPHAPQWLAGVADNAGDPLPSSERNRNVPFFQYSWKPWDLDQFNGDMKALEKFAGY